MLGLFVCLICTFTTTNTWAQFEKTPARINAATSNLEAIDLQGKIWNKAELAGKIVVLNFWGTWCAPCKDELPTLQKLHDTSDGQIVVLTISVREPAIRAERYMQSNAMTLPVISDAKGDLAKRWGVSIYPTTFLIDPRGQVRWRIVGDVDWSGAQAKAWLAQVAELAANKP